MRWLFCYEMVILPCYFCYFDSNRYFFVPLRMRFPLFVFWSWVLPCRDISWKEAMAAAVDFTNFEKECGLSLADETRQSLRLMKSKIYSEFLITAIKSVGDRCQNIMTLKFSTTSSLSYIFLGIEYEHSNRLVSTY